MNISPLDLHSEKLVLALAETNAFRVYWTSSQKKSNVKSAVKDDNHWKWLSILNKEKSMVDQLKNVPFENLLAFSDRAMTDIKKLADDEGLSISELIARAIKNERFIFNLKRAKAKFIIENKEGVLRQYYL